MSGSYTGTFTATGDLIAYSDERLKSNVKTLDGSKVYDMRGVLFNKDGKKSKAEAGRSALQAAGQEMSLKASETSLVTLLHPPSATARVDHYPGPGHWEASSLLCCTLQGKAI